MLLGMAVAALPTIIAVVHLNSSVDALARVPLPEGGLVSLPHPGGNVIYYEDHRSGSSAARYIPPIDLRITPVSAGAGVVGLAGTNPHRSSSYSTGGHHGVEVFAVQVTHPGQFRISDTGPAGPVAGTDLAIGPGVPADSLFLGILATILLAVFGIGVMAVFIFRRARRKFGPLRGADPSDWQFPASRR